jgi:hypothetical protein
VAPPGNQAANGENKPQPKASEETCLLDNSEHPQLFTVGGSPRIASCTRKIKKKGSGAKLVINGDSSQLALQLGANRIRVKNANGWSNILILST